MIYQKIVGAEMCAKLCSDLQKFNCKSFEYCDDISSCGLSPTHFMDIPRSDIKAEPLCDHYTSKYAKGLVRARIKARLEKIQTIL